MADVFSQSGFEQILNSPGNFYVMNFQNRSMLNHSDCKITYHDIDNSRSINYEKSVRLLEVDNLEIKSQINALEKRNVRINQQNLEEFLAEHHFSEIINTCKCENECGCGLNWLNIEELPSLATSFLLIEGYLAEDYPEYLSVFVEGALTSSDKNKLNSIRAGHELESDFKFTKLGSVVEDLTSRDFRFNSNLNHQLVDFISARIMSDFAKENEVSIWKQLFDKTNASNKVLVKFIIEHFVIYPESKLICAIKKYCEDALVSILDDIVFESQLTKLLIEQLKVSELEEVFDKQKENHVDYIADVTDLKSVCSNESYYEKLSQLGVKFNRLQEDENSKEEFKFVLTFEMFAFNWKMIRAIRNSILEQFNLGDEEQVTFAQLESLTGEESIYHEKLLSLIEDNIENFVANVLCKQNSYSEPLETFIEKLNQLDIELGSRMIKFSDTEVIDISVIKSKEHWCLLLDDEKLKPKWSNINACFESIYKQPDNEEDLSFNLEDSIRNYIQLDTSIAELVSSSQDLENLDSDFLLDNLLNLSGVSANVYEKLLPLFPSTNLYSDTELLSTIDKAEQLVINKLLDYSSDVVNWLISEEQEALLSNYIVQYATEYYEDSSSELLPVEGFDAILRSNLVAIELKTLYLKDILLNRYSEISGFDSLLPSMMETIEKVDFEVLCNFKIPPSLLAEMLKNQTKKFSTLRTKLVASQVNYLSWDELSNALSALSLIDFRSFISGTGNISIAKDGKFNIELLNALQKKGYVGKIKKNYLTYIGYTLKSKIPS